MGMLPFFYRDVLNFPYAKDGANHLSPHTASRYATWQRQRKGDAAIFYYDLPLTKRLLEVVDVSVCQICATP
jgi:hypothetical protein